MAIDGTPVEEARAAVLRALRSIEAEERQLRVALAALDGEKPTRRPPRTDRATRRPRVPARKLTNSELALVVVKRKPGSTASEVAEAMKQKVNNVYTPLEKLVAAGRLTKAERRYYPAD